MFLYDRIRPLLAQLPIEQFRNPPPIVPVIRLAGPIGQIGVIRSGLALSRLAAVIERAFSISDIKAVALVINSPGGSAVQSALIAKRIRDLASEKNLPVYAFVEDVAASGGYWLACAADEIYANANSIVGSIGVISSSFGFAELINKVGVTRRVYTAGEKKMMLDPFQPEDPEDVERLQNLQREIHGNFQSWVRERRGIRLRGLDSDLFSGEFWTGTRAVELGLVDGVDDLRAHMRRRFGDKVRLRLISAPTSWLRRWFGPHTVLPESWADDFVSALEARALWSRYGL
ncbi:MAG TPA: S49 family peptidase [Alphaproteobacteria bacterium]|nr:S49 family peptidase [Alphaproteobacteria bacterium]